MFKWLDKGNSLVWGHLLHVGGEANEVGTETEAGTLAGSEANAGGEQVEDGEDNGGNNGESYNLLELGDLLGDDNAGNSDGETLEEILDGASQKLRGSKTVHSGDSIFRAGKILNAQSAFKDRWKKPDSWK